MTVPRIEISDCGFQVLQDIIAKAQRELLLASFLLYDEAVANLLVEKRKSGAKVELLTTPPEAAKSDDLKALARTLQTRLQASGVTVIPCDWEVGQPQRTTSTLAGGRQPTWFAMHTKFLVTDRHAVVMSADLIKNFHTEGKWDSFVIYEDPVKIRLFRDKFVMLKAFFSEVTRRIDPQYIDTSVAGRKILRGYPPATHSLPVDEGFYILPLDTYGRLAVEHAIREAEHFVYCVYETFYDDKLTFEILKKLITNPQIDLKLISTPLAVYQQNPLKARANFLQLTSHGANIRNLGNLSAKMLITDKAVISGSFDLAVMGVGTFRTEKGLKLWVESTECMDVNTQNAFIQRAKASFLTLYERASCQHGEWFVKDAQTSLRAAGAETIAKDAKQALALLIFDSGRKSNEYIRKIASVAVETARLSNRARPYVKPIHIAQAEQILRLKERKELDADSLSRLLGIRDGDQFLAALQKIL